MVWCLGEELDGFVYRSTVSRLVKRRRINNKIARRISHRLGEGAAAGARP